VDSHWTDALDQEIRKHSTKGLLPQSNLSKAFTSDYKFLKMLGKGKTPLK
jgi:hypothetical protein